MANFNGLTFTVQPVVTGAGVLNTAGLPSGSLVAGILDPVNGVHRIYNPQVVGLPVVSGDNATVWLPVTNGAITAPGSILDNYWRSIPGQSDASTPKLGQIAINLTPAAKDVVNASSVQNFRVSANALVILASGTF